MKANNFKSPKFKLLIFFSFLFYFSNAQIRMITKPIHNTVNRNLSEINVLERSYGIAPNVLWPANQVECFYLGAPLFSLDTIVNSVSNFELSAKIEDLQTGLEVFNAMTTCALLSNCSYESLIFEDCFSPTLDYSTQYKITYAVSFETENNLSVTDTFSTQFETTDNLFSKETGATTIVAPASSNWEPNEPHKWAFGNYYYNLYDGPAELEATFGIGNAQNEDLVGHIIGINLYQWNEDINQDGNMDPSERESVASGVYEITGTEASDQLITVPLFELPSLNSIIYLEDETAYVLSIEFNTTSDTINFFMSASEEYNYSAQKIMSEAIQEPRYSSMLAINEDLLTESFSSVGFNIDVVPVARLQINELIIDATDDLEDNLTPLTISPNPASNQVIITLSNERSFQEGTLKIYTPAGEIMYQSFKVLSDTQQINLNVSHFAKGLYYAVFEGKDTAFSGRFIVL